MQRKGRPSQNLSTTQPSRKRSTQASQRPPASQSTLRQVNSKLQLSAETLAEYVNKCVRYFIYRAGSNIPIRKNDIQKDVLQHVGKNYEKIMTEVAKVLDTVYGYQLNVCEELHSTKTYILTVKLPYVNESKDDDIPKDVHKILIMLVLTHIFMSSSPVGEASLFSFLKSLNIDVERKHSVFGDVKLFINSAMMKQKYLTVKTDDITRKNIYSWGPRAESTVLKQDLLNFVCKIYKDRKPKAFTKQFEDANQQAMITAEEQNGEDASSDDYDEN